MSCSSEKREILILVQKVASNLPFVLDDVQIAKLAQFVELFSAWNIHFRFSQFTSPGDILSHLVVPSISLSLVLPKSGKVLDLGSGPGIPGLPLAIVDPDIRITCLDSHESSLEFVQVCAESLDLHNVRTVVARAEKQAHDPVSRETFDLVVARAFAPLPVLMEVGSGFAKVGSQLVVQSSKSVSSSLEKQTAELASLGMSFDRVGAFFIPQISDSPAFFTTFYKYHPTNTDYPRAWKNMKRQPIW